MSLLISFIITADRLTDKPNCVSIPNIYVAPTVETTCMNERVRRDGVLA